jgi:hypothetical protein
VKKSQEFVENSDSKRKRRKIEMFNWNFLWTTEFLLFCLQESHPDQ